MKKILPLVLFAMFFAVPVFAACPKTEKDVTVGAACSIQELNSSLVKNKSVKNNAMTESKRERNLRPIRLEGRKPSPDNSICIIGECLSKSLLEK